MSNASSLDSNTSRELSGRLTFHFANMQEQPLSAGSIRQSAPEAEQSVPIHVCTAYLGALACGTATTCAPLRIWITSRGIDDETPRDHRLYPRDDSEKREGHKLLKLAKLV